MINDQDLNSLWEQFTTPVSTTPDLTDAGLHIRGLTFEMFKLLCNTVREQGYHEGFDAAANAALNTVNSQNLTGH